MSARLAAPGGRGPAPRRVLMTADAVGGVWTYAVDLIRTLEHAGVRVTLATMGPEPDGSQRRELARLTDADLEVSSFRLEWMSEPWDDVEAAGLWLLDLADRVEPDLVHLNGYAHAALPWRIPVLVVGHSCVLSWWRSVRGGAAPAEWSRYETAVRSGLRGADLVVAPTRAMLVDLLELYGPLSNTSAVHNGRFSERPAPTKKRPEVLGVGRLWDAAKNMEALAEAAPAVRWPIRVAGDDRHPDGGHRSLAPLEVLGMLSRRALMKRMARASIYALPARYEPFGLSVLEAAGSGCALVLGDLPSLRELWGDTALYVDPDDPPALARALNRLIDDPEERARRAGAARQRARRYRPRAMGSAYLEHYRRLLLDDASRPQEPPKTLVHAPPPAEQ